MEFSTSWSFGAKTFISKQNNHSLKLSISDIVEIWDLFLFETQNTFSYFLLKEICLATSIVEKVGEGVRGGWGEVRVVLWEMGWLLGMGGGGRVARFEAVF